MERSIKEPHQDSTLCLASEDDYRYREYIHDKSNMKQLDTMELLYNSRLQNIGQLENR